MLTAAACVLVVLALAHSGLGELMIFRRFSGTSGMPELGFPPMLRRDTPHGTLRACWHILSIFGLVLAAVLARSGELPSLGPDDRLTVRLVAGALGASAVLIGALTRGRHMGWIGFAVASVLAWLGT